MEFKHFESSNPCHLFYCLDDDGGGCWQKHRSISFPLQTGYLKTNCNCKVVSSQITPSTPRVSHLIANKRCIMLAGTWISTVPPSPASLPLLLAPSLHRIQRSLQTLREKYMIHTFLRFLPELHSSRWWWIYSGTK